MRLGAGILYSLPQEPHNGLGARSAPKRRCAYQPGRSAGISRGGALGWLVCLENPMPITHRIAPCLWFADQAEEAANFYVSIFRNSRIVSVSRYTDVGQQTHRRPPGSVLTVAFELDGQPFTAL